MINNEIEYIVCSAILTSDLGKERLGGVEFVTGHRHFNIFRAFNNPPDNILVKRDPHSQGFMTSKGRFVGREEGLEIAKQSGQVPQNHQHRLLFSEDLY